MDFSERLERLGFNVSTAIRYDKFEDFETYLFNNYRLAYYIEDGNGVISILNFHNSRDWQVLHRIKISKTIND